MLTVHEFFEEQRTEAGAFVMENLVALMRNKPVADNFSVELYTKRFDSFILAYKKIDHKLLNKE